MVWLAFFHGDALSLLFAKDAAVAAASHSYLKAYAIDCMLTPFLFCFMGYYNGCEKTLFVMIQGIIGAFGVRIPIAYLVSRIRFPQLKEINGLFAFLLHFADKTVVDFNLLGAGVAFVFYGFMDDNLLDQGIQQFGSQF